MEKPVIDIQDETRAGAGGGRRTAVQNSSDVLPYRPRAISQISVPEVGNWRGEQRGSTKRSVNGEGLNYQARCIVNSHLHKGETW